MSYRPVNARYEAINDREKFEKELLETLHKALNPKEERSKEKHVRNTIIATWREKSSSTFWKLLPQLPIMRSHVVAWKACFIIHRIFRDGHEDVVKKTARHMKFLGDFGKHWTHSLAGYAPTTAAYVRMLMTRVTFIVKNPEIPGKLDFDEKKFEVPTDIDHVFSLSVEIFDLQSALLHLYAAIFGNLDPSGGITTDSVQCKLVPLIPSIQDSATLYDLIFKLMKGLHASLPAETLTGHRERFNRQYHALRKYFNQASKMKYLQPLVKIPVLGADPPSFLLPGQLIEMELARQVKVVEVDEEASITSTSLLVEPAEVTSSPTSSLVTLATPPPAAAVATASSPASRQTSQTSQASSRFDEQFGSTKFREGFDFSLPRSPVKDDKDLLIEQLMREVVELKEKIASLKEQQEADHTLMSGLRNRLHELEAELNDYKEIAEQTCNENVLLKRQIEASKTEAGAQSETEARAKASEEKFVKLRDVYQKLRSEHIVLLRTNGETQKELQVKEKEKSGTEEEMQKLEGKVVSLTNEIEEIKIHANDESAQVSLLREELRKKETESLQLEKKQQSLSAELEAKKEHAAPHQLIEDAVEEAESLIKRVLVELSEPAIGGTTCTPAILLTKSKACLDVIDKTTSNFSLYNNDPTAISKAVSSLPSLSYSMGEVMLQGAATSNNAPADNAKKLIDCCKAVGEECLKFLSILKMEKPGSGKIASGANDLQTSIRALQRNTSELVTVEEQASSEAQADALGDILDEELASTSQAVEAAAQRIQEMLVKSREDDTGVKLEVNERLLDSCTGLMKAIKILIARSKDLQKEIVGEGMGVNSNANDFYNKNSRWSEGLISAAKQVGWGASVLVDAADKAVTGNGKFEAMVVASHDIAASTAQLVAASRVKARPKSDKLKALKASSRNVSECTGQVVASAQSGSEFRRQGSVAKMDYSTLSLTQTKRLEMESQVKALELEKELEMERTRLAELRKVHYHLAGASEGWEEAEN